MDAPVKLLLLLGGLAPGVLAAAAGAVGPVPGPGSGARDGWSETSRAAVVSAVRVGAACPAPPAAEPGESIARRVIRYLADDALEGRLAGSDGERCAAEFVAREFERIGLRPAGPDGGFFQEVPLASAINPHAPAGTGRNVIARLDGRDPELRNEFVVIGAHIDHLGRGAMGSLAPDEKGAIHNGADDNASGVGALVALAERLAANPPARSVLFLAFTGEESGLLGSEYFVNHPTVPLAQVRAMLNMDMVGRLEADPMLVYGVATAEEWRAMLDEAQVAHGVPMVYHGDGVGPSDHTSFYLKDIPVLHFFTNVHEDYHRPSDDWEKIDFEGVEKVVAVVEQIARGVADRREVLTLVRGQAPPPATTRGSGYGAYLGTVPDYSPADYGVRLSGVREGSPADEAGLRAGDIIVRFDDEEIADLVAMTEALRVRKPGDTVRITVLRDGATVTVTAKLGSRGS